MALGGKRQTGNRAPVLAGLLVTALVALLQLLHLPSLDRLGLLLFDSYQRAAPRAYEDAPVRVSISTTSRSAASANGPGRAPRSRN